MFAAEISERPSERMFGTAFVVFRRPETFIKTYLPADFCVVCLAI